MSTQSGGSCGPGRGAPSGKPANTLCPVWINTGRTCRWDHSCRSHQLEVVDHAVQAMDESGHRCVVLAPYRFDADRAREASEWCSSRSLTWEVLPVTYWHRRQLQC